MMDVVVIGGGAAGLSAALVLGRARRDVVVVDAGMPRNAPAAAAHGMFTRDGTPPLELLSIGRAQLGAYPTVSLRSDTVTAAAADAGGFRVATAAGDQFRSRRILLACGLADSLPPIEGLHEFWGRSVLHCPYCHGWEVRDQPLAYIADGATAIDFGALLLGWSRDLILCTNGAAALTGEQLVQLKRNGIEVREERIVSVQGADRQLRSIVFEDGRVLDRAALFVRPAVRPRSSLAEMLRCEHTEAGLVAVDVLGRTSALGVYAAGDLVTPLQQVIRAAATGAAAAAGINHSLAAEDFARVAG